MTDHQQKIDAIMQQSREMRQRSGEVSDARPLVNFLYHLGRDHLPLGVIESLMMKNVEVATKATHCKFSNGYLAKWAQDVADRLVAGGFRPASPDEPDQICHRCGKGLREHRPTSVNNPGIYMCDDGETESSTEPYNDPDLTEEAATLDEESRGPSGILLPPEDFWERENMAVIMYDQGDGIVRNPNIGHDRIPGDPGLLSKLRVGEPPKRITELMNGWGWTFHKAADMPAWACRRSPKFNSPAHPDTCRRCGKPKKEHKQGTITKPGSAVEVDDGYHCDDDKACYSEEPYQNPAEDVQG
jgi:hypothetical protein